MNSFMKEYTKFYRFDITQPQMHNIEGNSNEKQVAAQYQAKKEAANQKQGEEFIDQITKPAYIGVQEYEVLLKDSADLYRAKVDMNEKFKINKS